MQINKRIGFWGICDYHTLLPQEEKMEQLYKLLYPNPTDAELKADIRKYKSKINQLYKSKHKVTARTGYKPRDLFSLEINE